MIAVSANAIPGRGVLHSFRRLSRVRDAGHELNEARGALDALIDEIQVNAPDVLPAHDSRGMAIDAGVWAEQKTRETMVRCNAQARRSREPLPFPMITDAIEADVVAGSLNTWDRRLKMYAYGRAAGVQRMVPDAIAFARDAANQTWTEFREQLQASIGRAALDAGGTAAYPGLIALMAIEEFATVPPTNSARIFPRVVGAGNLMPGISKYQVVRHTSIGQAGAISDGQTDQFNEFSDDVDHDLRWTEFYGMSLKEHEIARMRSRIPGSAVLGQDSLIAMARAAMGACDNKLFWVGAGADKLGLLDMPEVVYKDGGDVPAEGKDILEKIAEALGELDSNTKSVFAPDTIVISAYLKRLLTKIMGDAVGGIIAETCLSFLRSKMGPDNGITNVEFAWELDNLRAPGDTVSNFDTATAYTGILICRRDDIQRCSILEPTLMPEVQGMLVRRAPFLGQTGQPYHNGLSPSVIVRYHKTS
jgi:hypothetical protein